MGRPPKKAPSKAKRTNFTDDEKNKFRKFRKFVLGLPPELEELTIQVLNNIQLAVRKEESSPNWLNQGHLSIEVQDNGNLA